MINEKLLLRIEAISLISDTKRIGNINIMLSKFKKYSND